MYKVRFTEAYPKGRAASGPSRAVLHIMCARAGGHSTLERGVILSNTLRMGIAIKSPRSHEATEGDALILGQLHRKA